MDVHMALDIERTTVGMTPVYSPQQPCKMGIIASWYVDGDTDAQGLGNFPEAHC